MGIKGLQTFVQKQKLLKEYKLKSGSKVVIDGPGLLRYLHQRMSPHNTILYGGEYRSFINQCKGFLEILSHVGIPEAYVIFDGGWDDRKEKEIITRHEKKLEDFQNVTKSNPSIDSRYLPAFAKQCFLDAVDEFDGDFVKIHTAQKEADPEVARLARENCCPILSTDYDFLIYQTGCELIPLCTLDWESVKRDENNHLECQSVTAQELARELNIAIDKLPLFAALRIHNREGKDFKKMAQQLQGEGKSEDDIIAGRKHIKATCQSFRLDEADKARTPTPLQGIPKRLADLLDTGRMYHGAIVVWEKRRFIPVQQVENFEKMSSNSISVNIRSLWYSIICAGDKERADVTEFSRTRCKAPDKSRRHGSSERGGSVQCAAKVQVTLKQAVTFRSNKEISLTTPESLSDEQNRSILMVALQSEGKEADLTKFEEDLQLPLVVTRFWIKKARPTNFMKDAILSILAKSYTPSQRVNEVDFDINVAHAYAQWQSCLLSAYDLNLILGSPLPDFSRDILPNGSDLHRLAKTFKSGIPPQKSQLYTLMEDFLLG